MPDPVIDPVPLPLPPALVPVTGNVPLLPTGPTLNEPGGMNEQFEVYFQTPEIGQSELPTCGITTGVGDGVGCGKVRLACICRWQPPLADAAIQ